MRTAVVIGKMKDKQIEKGIGALLLPQDKTSFGYGLACGYAQGLEDAMNIINTDLEEANRLEASDNG